MLVELPTNDEIHDNIVAFWNPLAPAVAGNTYDVSYKLNWVKKSPAIPIAQFVGTRLGAGGVPGQPRPPNVVKFVLDLTAGGWRGSTGRAASRRWPRRARASSTSWSPTRSPPPTAGG